MDYEQMQQVLLNILINAVDSIEGPGGKITVLSKYESDNLVIEIEDTGYGIDEIDKESIFKPFFSTKSNGTGLGLAISHKIVEAHNGVIKVDSEKGKGSTFSIIIPMNSQKEDIVYKV